VDVTTLEADPRGAEVLWTYTSRQLYTNKTGPLCDKLYGEEKETFSWKNPPVTIGGKKFRQLAVNFPEIP
jgi:hypothetical protein